MIFFIKYNLLSFSLVSVGGTVSFFTGVCVLGVIEIIYFFYNSIILAYLRQKVRTNRNWRRYSSIPIWGEMRHWIHQYWRDTWDTWCEIRFFWSTPVISIFSILVKRSNKLFKISIKVTFELNFEIMHTKNVQTRLNFCFSHRIYIPTTV